MARKSLASIVKTSADVEQHNEEQNDLKKLEEYVDKVGELNDTYRTLGKQLTENKDTIKALLSKFKYDDYTSPNGTRVTTSTVDKSYLDEQLVLNYLREHGFDKYIKTKEFFDQTEIAMAIANNEIAVEDLAPFRVEKTEVRLNIKK